MTADEIEEVEPAKPAATRIKRLIAVESDDEEAQARYPLQYRLQPYESRLQPCNPMHPDCDLIPRL